MSDLLELATQYRESGLMCRSALKKLRCTLDNEQLRAEELIELRRRITLVTAMARECLATSNYLKKYHERRGYLERYRKEAGV